ncbi:MAG: hypothetical protein QW175_05290 [Candidatus Bathyarchaeia archaeon]
MNNRGVAWIWVSCLIAIVIFSIAWFVLSPVALTIIDSVTAYYPSDIQWVITIAKNVLQWFPIIMIFGLLLWAYVRSQRPQDVSYPYVEG